jgi:hypothetical protein
MAPFPIAKGQLPNVINYIKNQEEHHQKISFHDEYIELLKEFEIDYKTPFCLLPSPDMSYLKARENCIMFLFTNIWSRWDRIDTVIISLFKSKPKTHHPTSPFRDKTRVTITTKNAPRAVRYEICLDSTY